MSTRYSKPVICPDGRTRTATSSPRECKRWALSLTRIPWNDARLRCRVQVNGLSVWGKARWSRDWQGHSVLRFEADNGGSPAWLNKQGRELAARILLGVADREAQRGRHGSVLAVLPRIKRLLGRRGPLNSYLGCRA